MRMPRKLPAAPWHSTASAQAALEFSVEKTHASREDGLRDRSWGGWIAMGEVGEDDGEIGK